MSSTPCDIDRREWRDEVNTIHIHESKTGHASNHITGMHGLAYKTRRGGMETMKIREAMKRRIEIQHCSQATNHHLKVEYVGSNVEYRLVKKR